MLDKPALCDESGRQKFGGRNSSIRKLKRGNRIEPRTYCIGPRSKLTFDVGIRVRAPKPCVQIELYGDGKNTQRHYSKHDPILEPAGIELSYREWVVRVAYLQRSLTSGIVLHRNTTSAGTHEICTVRGFHCIALRQWVDWSSHKDCITIVSNVRRHSGDRSSFGKATASAPSVKQKPVRR